jgi:drug/metabolite transporter (DMT)-like permease
MNWAQKDVSPTRATLIYASGPIWGGAIGLLLGEHLSMLAVGGALLITVGMVLSEWRPRVGMANSPALPPTRR